MHLRFRPVSSLLLGVACLTASLAASDPDDPPARDPRPDGAVAQPTSDAADPPPQEQAAGGEGPEAESQPVQDSVRTPPAVSAEDVLKAFQKHRPTRTPIPPSVGFERTPFPGEAAVTAARLPDGYFLVDRAGRLLREGEWHLFAFEAYNESEPEPPMKLLPNQLLERMVLESEGTGGGTIFIVSGEVTEFQGENYLLLRKLLRRRNLGNLRK